MDGQILKLKLNILKLSSGKKNPIFLLLKPFVNGFCQQLSHSNEYLFLTMDFALCFILSLWKYFKLGFFSKVNFRNQNQVIDDPSPTNNPQQKNKPQTEIRMLIRYDEASSSQKKCTNLNSLIYWFL